MSQISIVSHSHCATATAQISVQEQLKMHYIQKQKEKRTHHQMPVSAVFRFVPFGIVFPEERDTGLGIGWRLDHFTT